MMQTKSALFFVIMALLYRIEDAAAASSVKVVAPLYRLSTHQTYNISTSPEYPYHNMHFLTRQMMLREDQE